MSSDRFKITSRELIASYLLISYLGICLFVKNHMMISFGIFHISVCQYIHYFNFRCRIISCIKSIRIKTGFNCRLVFTRIFGDKLGNRFFHDWRGLHKWRLLWRVNLFVYYRMYTRKSVGYVYRYRWNIFSA